MEFGTVDVGLGIWLVIDGLYSIFEYRKQTIQEHLIRIIRAGVGVTLITLVLPLEAAGNMNDCRFTVFISSDAPTARAHIR